MKAYGSFGQTVGEEVRKVMSSVKPEIEAFKIASHSD